MNNWQAAFIFLYSLYGMFGAIRAYHECKSKGNSYGLTPQYYLYGAFVWGDILIFGLFWFVVGIVTLAFQDWLLFLLIQSLFWLVRSAGETVYWFLEQFAYKSKNHPASLPGFHIVGDDSIWFIYQIIAQLITVVSLLATIILVPLWLSSIGILRYTKSIKDVLKDFNPVEDKYISRDFQAYGIELSEKLDDYKHLGLYIRLAKTHPRVLLDRALSFTIDSNAKNKGALFMWKLKEMGLFKKTKKVSSSNKKQS